MFIHQQMYLITSQREKRVNLVTWEAKAWMWGGIILLEKVIVLNKVYGCFSVFKRGAFVKWHVSLCIFQETTELLIKCRRKQLLSLYVKTECFFLNKTIFWFNLYSFCIFFYSMIFPKLLKLICDFLTLMKSILKASWCLGEVDGCLLIHMFQWIWLNFCYILCVYSQSRHLSQIVIYIKWNCVSFLVILSTEVPYIDASPSHWASPCIFISTKSHSVKCSLLLKQYILSILTMT